MVARTRALQDSAHARDDVHAAREQLRLMAGLMPPDALNFVGDQMLRIADGREDRLGLAFVFSLLLSLWSANAGMKSLFDGLNIAYEEKEKRGYFVLNAIALGFTLGGVLFILLILTAVIALPVGLAGVWVFLFARNLRSRALLCVG